MDNNESVVSDILDFVFVLLKIMDELLIILVVIVLSRDFYELVDFYEGLLSFNGVELKWLFLIFVLVRVIISK